MELCQVLEAAIDMFHCLRYCLNDIHNISGALIKTPHEGPPCGARGPLATTNCTYTANLEGALNCVTDGNSKLWYHARFCHIR